MKPVKLQVIIFVSILCSPVFSCLKTKKDASCTLQWSEKLPSWFPLIWEQSSIKYPVATGKNLWEIILPSKNGLNISCSNDKNFLSKTQTPSEQLSCKNGKFKLGKQAVTFEELGCEKPLSEIVTTTGQCDDKFKEIKILFQVQETKFPLITVCHDSGKDETIMAHHVIQGNALNTFEISNKRPSFKEAQYFKDINVNSAYKQTSQRKMVAELVGSENLAGKYIDASQSFYFARGHLAPDGDFVHIYEQNATYYFVNVIPQWQSINNGNWKSLETSVRRYAMVNGLELEVWTGAKGILKLPDENDNLVEIYLAKDKNRNLRLPVPEITWKVIRNPKSRKAVAVFMVNNPHLASIPSDLLLCPDVCSKIPWINWKTQIIKKGYTYCCDLKSAKEVLPQFLPNFENEELLV